MALKLKKTEEYQTYFKGLVDADGEQVLLKGMPQRPTHLPPFTRNANNEIVVALGEVYCRFSKLGDVIDCTNKLQFFSESNMRGHIVKHEEEDGTEPRLEARKPGAASLAKIEAATVFYRRLNALKDGPPTQQNAVVTTPSKKRKSTSRPAAALLQLPTVKRGNKTFANVSGMLSALGESTKTKKNDRCDGCKGADEKKCPPKERTTTCVRWAKFAYNKAVEGPEEEPEEDSEPEEPEEGDKSGAEEEIQG